MRSELSRCWVTLNRHPVLRMATGWRRACNRSSSTRRRSRRSFEVHSDDRNLYQYRNTELIALLSLG